MSFVLQNGMIVANVTSADDGLHTLALTATQGSIKTTLTLAPIVVGPVPIITVTPNPIPAVPDNSPAGAVLATVSVKMSDGSPFTGTLTLVSNP